MDKDLTDQVKLSYEMTVSDEKDTGFISRITSFREGYKVRKQKIVWKFPNLGGVRHR